VLVILCPHNYVFYRPS